MESTYSKKTVLKRIYAFLRPYRLSFVFIMLVGCLASFLNVKIPDEIKVIAGIIQDEMADGIRLEKIIGHGAAAGVIVLLLFLCNLIYNRGMETKSQEIGRDMRGVINDKLNRIRLIEYDRISSGDLIVRISTDVDNVCTAISKSVGALFVNFILLIGAIVMMVLSSIPLTLVVLIFLAAGTTLSLLFSRKMIPLQRSQRKDIAVMNRRIDEALSGHLVIKAYNAEEELIETFNKKNDEMTGKLKKSQIIAGLLTPLMSLVNNMTYVAICIAGTYLITKGYAGVNIGTIVAFILYARILSSPVLFFAGILGQLSLAYVSAAKILELLDMEEMADEGTAVLDQIKGEVVFDNVRFGYDKGSEIIHGFSAKVKPGMKVAVVGPTGAGKTTLINLLMRFYETDSGTITIDGTNLCDIKRRSLHDALGMVLQDTIVFDGSVRENIVYSTKGVTEDELNAVIEKCGLKYLIDTMPQGIDTVISGESAVSAGQKQLITIARTMLKKPSILILDEATASIDTRTEMLIQKALDELSAGKTSFVIAHRLSTIRNADVIFVLQDGDIVETGTHEELLRRGQAYADLYNSQFEAL